MTSSARYDYYPIAPATGTRPVASLLQLATNVVTDWMPGVPNSLALAFSDLLGEMLKVESLDGDDLWIVAPRMTGFEKQWKLGDLMDTGSGLLSQGSRRPRLYMVGSGKRIQFECYQYRSSLLGV